MSIQQGLCAYNEELYAAWKGEVGDDRVYYSRFNGRDWDTQTFIAGLSSVGPSLAWFGGSVPAGLLFAAWKGEQSDQRLWYASFDGKNWSAQAQIPSVASSVGPSLCGFNGKLYAAWKGELGDQSLWYASFNGKNWSAQAQIHDLYSTIGPALAEFNNKLYAAWKGASDQNLWYASFDGANWSAQVQIPGVGSSIGPSLSPFGDKLYAAWKSGSDQSLWYASFEGSDTTPAQIPEALSSIGPALAQFKGKLYAMWVGASDQSLWYASFDGQNWSAQARVPGYSGQDLPPQLILTAQKNEIGYDVFWSGSGFLGVEVNICLVGLSGTTGRFPIGFSVPDANGNIGGNYSFLCGDAFPASNVVSQAIDNTTNAVIASSNPMDFECGP